jgi:hypothetical protein
MKTHRNLRLQILFLFSIGCFLPSCNKSDNHSWEGRVLEYGSNKPVANATVYLVEKSGSGILGPVGSSTVDSLITGTDGKFKFKFIDGPVAHYIRGKADLYYETELSRNGNSPSKTKTDLILDPHAWLRIHVKNVSPVDSADFLSIGLNPGDCPKGFPGMTVDTFMICDKYKGNRTKNLKYAVTKRSTGRVELIKEILMGAHDTTDLLIEY